MRVLLPFGFENMWLNEEDFKNLINEWWCSLEIRGLGNYVLTEKLKAIKVQLKNWNKNYFGRVEERKP